MTLFDSIAAAVFVVAILLIFAPLYRAIAVLEEEERLRSSEEIPSSGLGEAGHRISSLGCDLRVVGGGSRGPEVPQGATRLPL